jgi:(1->4)-alpha-D-glucan 1-alpha-D-glucosylmutase
MIGTATHDTKRGEDTRARIDAISEVPDVWRRAVGRWMRINASARTIVDGNPAPDRADEYLFYQTLVGVWPPPTPGSPLPQQAPSELVDRLSAYMQKAIKEAKVHTSWVSQDVAYETAVRQFVHRTLTGRTAPAFLASFLPFARRVDRLGLCNALSQLVLKLTSPGVVDLYQGSELWDLKLVDPDNRQPVDFARRRALIEELEPLLALDEAEPRAAGVHALMQTWPDGRVKLFMTAALLRARRDAARVFLEGSYTPVWGVDEVAQRHLVAFARRLGNEVRLTVAPRVVGSLLADEADAPLGRQVWHDARLELPPEIGADAFVNLITGERVTVSVFDGRRVLYAADLLSVAPAAVLRGAGNGS